MKKIIKMGDQSISKSPNSRYASWLRPYNPALEKVDRENIIFFI